METHVPVRHADAARRRISLGRHLLQYVTWRAKASIIMKLRRLAKRLRYRCGRCFALLNHPHPTRRSAQGGGASSSATMTRRDAASPCVAGPLDDLLDKQPAVVEVRVRRLGRDLLHAAPEVVVAVGMMPHRSNIPQTCNLLSLHNISNYFILFSNISSPLPYSLTPFLPDDHIIIPLAVNPARACRILSSGILLSISTL